MTASVLDCYDAGLRAVADGADTGWYVRSAGGERRPLPLARWHGDAVAGDSGLLDRCSGPTLDVGCGPGRLTAALHRRGVPALGIDLAAEAVRLTTARGASALRRDVFGRVPGEGRWRHVILADGNVGIGGDPLRLLIRIGRLLAPGGTAVVELARPGTALHRERLRLERADVRSAWFSWARLGDEGLRPIAAAAGLAVEHQWTEAGRWFALLRRC